MNDNKAHYDLYVMAESKYVNSHKDLEKSSLFPEDWYSSDNYFLKSNFKSIQQMNQIVNQNHISKSSRKPSSKIQINHSSK